MNHSTLSTEVFLVTRSLADAAKELCRREDIVAPRFIEVDEPTTTRTADEVLGGLRLEMAFALQELTKIFADDATPHVERMRRVQPILGEMFARVEDEVVEMAPAVSAFR